MKTQHYIIELNSREELGNLTRELEAELSDMFGQLPLHSFTILQTPNFKTQCSTKFKQEEKKWQKIKKS